MQKRGINPVTIRPLDTHPGNAVTFSRMHVDGLIKTGRAVAKSTSLLRHGRLKMFSVVVFDEAEVEAARKTEREPRMHAAVVDEDKFIDALGHLFPNGELALAHLNVDANMLGGLIDLVRGLASMKKDGEPNPDEPDDEEGFVMENDDTHGALCDVIDMARDLEKRLDAK